MNEKKLVPRRRFEEFQNADAWEQRELGGVTDIFDGTHQTPKYTASGVKFVSVENINNLETKKYISQEAYEKEYSNKQAEKGDVLMTRIGDIGTTKVIETDQPLAYYVTLALLKPKTMDSDFLSWALASPGVQSDIWKRTLHIAFPKKINLGEINQLKLAFPSNSEQIQIGKFFKHLDQMISLEQRKLEKTKALKSAYLAEMFPAEGERVPKRRFAGFTEEWERVSIEDLMEVTSVKRIHQADWTSEGVPFLRARDIVSYNKKELPKDRLYITKEKYEEYSRISGKAEKGDLLVTGVGTIGIPFLIKDDNPIYFKDGNIIWFRNRNKINELFFYYSFINKYTQNYIKNVAGIGTVGTFTIESGRRLSVNLPKYKEQQLIGKFFKKLDESITNQQQKLNKLKAMKQAYLEEMFV